MSFYPLFALLLVGLTIYGLVVAVRGTPPKPVVVAITLGAWLLALLFMTLRPAGSAVRLNLVPDLGGSDFSGFDTIANVAVFVPLGLILAAAGWRALPAVGLGLAVSLAVEVTQFIVDAGRAADINDVITNTAGAALGWVVAWAIRRRLSSSASRATPRRAGS